MNAPAEAVDAMHARQLGLSSTPAEALPPTPDCTAELLAIREELVHRLDVLHDALWACSDGEEAFVMARQGRRLACLLRRVCHELDKDGCP